MQFNDLYVPVPEPGRLAHPTLLIGVISFSNPQVPPRSSHDLQSGPSHFNGTPCSSPDQLGQKKGITTVLITEHDFVIPCSDTLDQYVGTATTVKLSPLMQLTILNPGTSVRCFRPKSSCRTWTPWGFRHWKVYRREKRTEGTSSGDSNPGRWSI